MATSAAHLFVLSSRISIPLSRKSPWIFLRTSVNCLTEDLELQPPFFYALLRESSSSVVSPTLLYSLCGVIPHTCLRRCRLDACPRENGDGIQTCFYWIPAGVYPVDSRLRGNDIRGGNDNMSQVI